MNKTYHYEIPAGLYDGVVSREFDTIEECVEEILNFLRNVEQTGRVYKEIVDP